MVLNHRWADGLDTVFNFGRDWNLRDGHTSHELEARSYRVRFRAKGKGEVEILVTRIMALKT